MTTASNPLLSPFGATQDTDAPLLHICPVLQLVPPIAIVAVISVDTKFILPSVMSALPVWGEFMRRTDEIVGLSYASAFIILPTCSAVVTWVLRPVGPVDPCGTMHVRDESLDQTVVWQIV